MASSNPYNNPNAVTAGGARTYSKKAAKAGKINPYDEWGASGGDDAVAEQKDRQRYDTEKTDFENASAVADKQRQEQEQQKEQIQKEAKKSALSRVAGNVVNFVKDTGKELGKSAINTVKLPTAAGSAAGANITKTVAEKVTGKPLPSEAQKKVDTANKTWQQTYEGSMVAEPARQAMHTYNNLNPAAKQARQEAYRVIDKQAEVKTKEDQAKKVSPVPFKSVEDKNKSEAQRKKDELARKLTGVDESASTGEKVRRGAADAASTALNAATFGTGAAAKKTVETTGKAVAKEVIKKVGTGAVLAGTSNVLAEAGREKDFSIKDVPGSFAKGAAAGAAITGAGAGLGVPKRLQGKANAVEEVPLKTAPKKPTVKVQVNDELVNQNLIKPKVTYEPIQSLEAGADTVGKLDPVQVQKYVDDIDAGKPIQPLIVTHGEGKTFVQDGKHRMAAMQKRGIEDIPTVERVTTPRATTPGALKPLNVEGEVKKTGLAAGVEAKAVEKKLTKGFGELPEYKKVNMKEQADFSAQMLADDEQRAIRIATGKENAPDNILPESVFVAVENKALKDGNVELLRDLATSTRTGEATAMGQRIRALAERDPDSPVAAIKQVGDLRREAAERRLKKQGGVDKAVASTVREIQATKRAPNRVDWNTFIESIKC